MTDEHATELEPRIAPLQPPYEDELAAMLAKWMPPGADVEPLAIFRTLAHHPELMGRMRPLGAGILGRGLLSVRDRELVIDRTCARMGAEYEWGVHATAFGAAAGLTEAELDATATVPSGEASTSGAFAGHDALVLDAVDELLDAGAIGDATFAALAAEHATDGILELVIATGWYRLVSTVLLTARTPLEPWGRRFPA